MKKVAQIQSYDEGGASLHAEIKKTFGAMLAIQKPAGISSQAVLTRLKKRFGYQKMGHAGTLDPLARGLLVVAVGEGTKYLSYVTPVFKRYAALLQLGLQSDTEDRLGRVKQVTDLKVCAEVSLEDFKKKLACFQGRSMQIPPNYSALKVQGRARYSYARQNVVIAPPPPREIFVQNFQNICRHAPGLFSFEVDVSPGTYIRSLVRDIGQQLGTQALLMELIRLKADPFDLTVAEEWQTLLEKTPLLFESHALKSMRDILKDVMPVICFSTTQMIDFSHGRSCFFEKLPDWVTHTNLKSVDKIAACLKIGSEEVVCGILEIHWDKKCLSPQRWIGDALSKIKSFSKWIADPKERELV